MRISTKRRTIEVAIGPSANRAAAKPAIPAENLPLFRARLLSWYRETKRDLDWRHTRDPYAIWLSEVMLQQTRVAVVLPYYRRFLERFPTVHHLARAPVAAVLRHWAGLGYYSRARNLHRAAKQIVAEHRGMFPRAPAAALLLPGIGTYTAAAVLSIAYDVPLAVLDGNVARVVARLGAFRDTMNADLRQPRLWRRLASTANQLLPPAAPGDWNQAMMELGATVCTPRSPSCAQCPVASWCRAQALGIADRLPGARRKPATVQLTLAAAVLLDPQGRTLLVRHTDAQGALFSRLWQFPSITRAAQAASRAVSQGTTHIKAHRLTGPTTQGGRANDPAGKALALHLARHLGIADVPLTPLAEAKHSVTFRSIRLAPFLALVDRLPAVDGARTLPLDAIDRLPVSSATRKIAAAVLHALSPQKQNS